MHELLEYMLNTEPHISLFSSRKHMSLRKCLDQEEKKNKTKEMHIYQMTSNTGQLKSQGRQIYLQTTYICTLHMQYSLYLKNVENRKIALNAKKQSNTFKVFKYVWYIF